MPTSLHQDRLDIVIDALRTRRARRVLDLGCGTGPLLLALAESDFFEQIVGLDISRKALEQCARDLQNAGFSQGQRIQLLNDSFAEMNPRFTGFDAAVLLETIEHIPPDRLSKVERAVFSGFRPGVVLITTPNRECNEILGVPSHRLRHPGHEFEWDRAKFQAWAQGVAARSGYHAAFMGLGPAHPVLGSPNQMALFTRTDA
jgi:small RNA 2'-O-methyltransferase